jgi:uncharacterized protein (TIGR02284 family)
MENQSIKEASGKLMKVNLDAFEGYRTAAENTNDSRITTFFEQAALQRKEFAKYWAANLDNPSYKTDLKADFHRVWMNIKTGRNKYNASAILNECKRGEEHALDQYQQLREVDLPKDVQEVLDKQKRDIEAALQQIHNMKKDYEEKDHDRNNDTPVP